MNSSSPRVGVLAWLGGSGLRRRCAELEERVERLEHELARVPPRRQMRDYLGLRWAPDGAADKQIAHCNICWHEGREMPLEVHELPEQDAVALLCHHPVHGSGGLRLVRDAGGFHWGERELEPLRVTPG